MGSLGDKDSSFSDPEDPIISLWPETSVFGNGVVS